MKTIKKKHCKHTCRGHNCKCSCKKCRCRRGGTKKETPKAKAAKASRKRTPTAEVAYEDKQQKLLHIDTLVKATGFPKKSVQRMLAKKTEYEVGSMSNDKFVEDYKKWRAAEAEARRNLRHGKKGISAKSALTDEEAADALMLFKQPSHNIDSLEDFQDATAQDFLVSPGAQKTIEGDTYDDYRFTPKKLRPRSHKTISTSAPKALFKFSPVDLSTKEEDEEDAVLSLLQGK